MCYVEHDGRQVFAPQSLGERIAHERRRLGLREGRDILAPQLALMLSVSGESVYKWETGGTVPSRANIQRMASLFGVSPAYLEYGVGDTKRPVSIETGANTDVFDPQPALDYKVTEEQHAADEREYQARQAAKGKRHRRA